MKILRFRFNFFGGMLVIFEEFKIGLGVLV